MPATISEVYTSRPFTLGQQATRELIYIIRGTDEESEVASLLSSTAPGLYFGLPRDTLSAEPQGGGVWMGYVRYAGIDSDSEFTFDTGGGSAKITQSLTTVNTYGTNPPNFQGAIGVSEDRVEGVEITIPQFEFTETHRFTDAQVTGAYRQTLFTLTGRTNNATFKGFAAGEVLFLGAQGSKRGNELWSLTFRFAASKNLTGQTVGTITGVAKAGWDYLWVRYADFEDATAVALVKRPVAVYVERVYEPGDFAGLGIGTT
jgi:hypothetical protein